MGKMQTAKGNCPLSFESLRQANPPFDVNSLPYLYFHRKFEKKHMKLLPICLLFIFINSCANAKEAIYTGSTPANSVVKAFLGIPLKDSIDFIRWKLVVNDNR